MERMKDARWMRSRSSRQSAAHTAHTHINAPFPLRRFCGESAALRDTILRNFRELLIHISMIHTPSVDGRAFKDRA
jgi:hypothetical protein